MRRLTTVLLAVLGVLLVVSWVVASGGAPQPPAAPAAPPAPPPAPELAIINREIDRLTERLSAPADDTTPIRDPFQFGAPVEIAPATSWVQPPGQEARMKAEPSEPQVDWPRLVAIVSSGDDSSSVWRAVFEDERRLVQIRSAGESLGDVTVEAVSADAVTLVHGPSGTSRHVLLD